MIEHLTKDSFKQKVFDYQDGGRYKFEGERPALIDFYANWSGTCKTIALILEELKREYEGKIDIYKVDSEVERELARAFRVHSIPTLLFVPMLGQPQLGRGALSKGELMKYVKEVFNV